MKNKIAEVITSLIFVNELLKQETIKSLIMGGRSKQRELLIRNIIFEVLNKIYPGEFEKETMGRKDLWWVVQKIICEMGHNGTWQPSQYSINKIIRDYEKRRRQGIFYGYTACHIISHFEKLNLTHGVARSYVPTILKLKQSDAEKRIETVKNFASSCDNDALYLPLKAIEYDGTILRLHFIVLNLQ